ncbi:hypothetical protein OEZ86_009576 [Tetradesmus obliquus]|nr:hypothetical protein OEZ86_009576 [Tetradesmus obliquus]
MHTSSSSSSGSSQQLELSVLGGVRGPREGLSQLAASLSEVDSRLHSFSFCELLLGKHQPAVGHSRLAVRGVTWDYRSSCSITALQGIEALSSMQQQQQQQQHLPGQLRALALRFDWVSCQLPMVPGGTSVGLSQLLTFLQANAPQLQQLKVAAGQTRPILDWHVPLLLRMPQLRKLEAFVGTDVAGEIAARFKQQQQLAGASAAAAAATAPPQQQQLSEVLAAMQGMQQHLLQAARYARQVHRLAGGHIAAAAPEEDAELVAAQQPGTAIDQAMALALKHANQLLNHPGCSALTGMSAAAAAQLRQGLAAGSCGCVELHREWKDVAVAEFSADQVTNQAAAKVQAASTTTR